MTARSQPLLSNSYDGQKGARSADRTNVGFRREIDGGFRNPPAAKGRGRVLRSRRRLSARRLKP